MKTSLASILALSFSLLACGSHDSSDLKSPPMHPGVTIPVLGALEVSAQIELDLPKAGLDYPTDAPMFDHLKGKKILAINTTKRIVVPADSELGEAKNSDFPTDVSVSEAASNRSYLLTKNLRLAIVLVHPVAGRDVPTDVNFDKSALIWDFGFNQRVPLKEILSIEKAVAGVDFPTDGPAAFDRDFYVYTIQDSKFNIIRTAIQATRN